MTLLPGGVDAGFPHPALLIGVVTIVASGKGVPDGGAGEEEQLAASRAQSAITIPHILEEYRRVQFPFFPQRVSRERTAEKSAMGAKDFNALHCVSLRPLRELDMLCIS